MLVRIAVLRIVVAPADANTNAPPLNSTSPVASRFVTTEAGISRRLHQIAQLHQPRRKKVSGPRRTLVGYATTVKVGSGPPFAAFYCGDGIYCPIAQVVFSKPSSGADHGAADDAGEQVLDWRGLADWEQQFIADQWQYVAVGLIHRGEAPRHGLVDFRMQAAGAGVGGERLFERTGLEGFGQC